jgi:hypothetical protein
MCEGDILSFFNVMDSYVCDNSRMCYKANHMFLKRKYVPWVSHSFVINDIVLELLHLSHSKITRRDDLFLSHLL